MGYFPNGTSHEIYESNLCAKCVHYDDCAVMNAHWLYNYDECNNEKSILHILIPRTKDDGGNEKCRMFYQAQAGSD